MSIPLDLAAPDRLAQFERCREQLRGNPVLRTNVVHLDKLRAAAAEAPRGVVGGRLSWEPVVLAVTAATRIPTVGIVEPKSREWKVRSDDDEDNDCECRRWSHSVEMDDDSRLAVSVLGASLSGQDRAVSETAFIGDREMATLLNNHTLSEVQLAEFGRALGSWFRAVFERGVCIVHMMEWPPPSQVRSMVMTRFSGPTSITVGLYKVDRQTHNVEQVASLLSDVESSLLSCISVCASTRRVTVVTRAGASCYSGDCGVLLDQTTLAKHDLMGGCWLPTHNVMLLTGAHVRSVEGRVVSWHPGQGAPLVNVFEFKGAHVVSIVPSPTPISPYRCLCALVRNDFSVAVGVWCAASGGEPEAFHLLAQLSTPPTAFVPSVRFSPLQEVVVFSGGVVTIWSLSSYIAIHVALGPLHLRPVSFPRADVALLLRHVSKMCSMELVSIRGHDFAICNLGSALGFVHMSTRTVMEVNTSLPEEVLRVSRVDFDPDTLVLSLRTQSALYVLHWAFNSLPQATH